MTTTVRPCPLPLSNLPHMLRLIVDHADRNTVATLLRTSYQLFQLCGPRLYREVCLDFNTLGGVFLGWDDERHSYTSKRCLLKHIKIVSVTLHNHVDCTPLAPVVASLISPDVVRVVCPILSGDTDMIDMCANDPCDFLPNIDTKKIVLRNVDNSQGFKIFSPWIAPKLEEMVYVLPRDARTTGQSYQLEDEIDEHWQEAPKLKLVFGDYEKPTPRGLGLFLSVSETFEEDQPEPLGRFGLIQFLESAMHPNRTLEVCGVNTIPFLVDGEVRRLDQEEIKEVEAQARLQETNEEKFEAELVFKTMEEYCMGDTYGEVTQEEKDRWLEEDKRLKAQAGAPTADMDVD